MIYIFNIRNIIKVDHDIILIHPQLSLFTMSGTRLRIITPSIIQS